MRAEGKEDDAKCTGSCDSCGLAKDKMQCDGSGRIIGGMGAIPLFSWWPIKAYRPCPGLIESGGVYVRKGQDVDSILWGEKGKLAPVFSEYNVISFCARIRWLSYALEDRCPAGRERRK